MKIAIVGTGISGLAVAYRLHRHHDITVYEAADRIGGHTATIDVRLDGREYRIDMLRFNRLAVSNVIQDRLPPDLTLSEYVSRKRLGKAFRDFYLVPMASTIWSTPLEEVYEFPVRFMLPFLYHHGLLSPADRSGVPSRAVRTGMSVR